MIVCGIVYKPNYMLLHKVYICKELCSAMKDLRLCTQIANNR